MSDVIEGRYAGWKVRDVSPLTPEAARELADLAVPVSGDELTLILPNTLPVAMLVLRDEGLRRTAVVPGMVTRNATVVPHDDERYGQEYNDIEDGVWETETVEALGLGITARPDGRNSVGLPVVALLRQRLQCTGEPTIVKLGQYCAGRISPVTGGRLQQDMPRLVSPPEPVRPPYIVYPRIDLGPWTLP